MSITGYYRKAPSARLHQSFIYPVNYLLKKFICMIGYLLPVL
jgi:hypothetical protein